MGVSSAAVWMTFSFGRRVLFAERVALLDAVVLRFVEHRDETDDAAVAAVPVPREEGEGDALAGHRVEVAADVLNAENAVGEELAVHGLPLGMGFLPVDPARPFLEFLGQMRMQRAVAVRADRGGERMVV